MNYPCDIEIIIDNPVLLEILQRYKDQGLFWPDNYRYFGIGVGDYLDVWKNLIDYQDVRTKTRTPAFYFKVGYEDSFFTFKPGFFDEDTKILDRVLEDILIRAMDGMKFEAMKIFETGDSAPQIFDPLLNKQMKEELLQRKDEIDRAYIYVYYWNEQQQDDAYFREEYEFDLINGESYSCEGDPEEYYS